MSGRKGPITLDTNIVIYALLRESKADAALAALGASDFLSAQILNEYASVAFRKLRRTWSEIAADLVVVREAVPTILPLDERANLDALRIAERYRLSFYDSLIIAVALAGGAQTLYSEDMQHDLVIDGTLRVVDPFRPEISAGEPAR